ncbi:Flp family type IVb pilin [Arthrobacter crystallopoietes]|uniref:Flp family type IVb pilin n=1 Tax=Crystallibacter crystallopoietes TaxID=37928 RepID=UPI003D1E240F
MLGLFSSARKSVIGRVSREEKGATAVEYGLIVGLIAVVIVVAVTFLGGQVQNMFQTAACGIQGKTYSAAVAPAADGTGGSAAKCG